VAAALRAGSSVNPVKRESEDIGGGTALLIELACEDLLITTPDLSRHENTMMLTQSRHL